MLKTYEFAEISIREIINTEKINLETFLEIAVSIVNTLMELQQKSINNYRFYPENIIVSKKNSEISIKIVNMPKDTRYIQYMSPEETGVLNAKCDFRKDFYTLGIIFYEMLTKHSLIKGEDSLEITYMHLTKEFKEPENKSRDVPKILWEILKKLVNKNPGSRYLSYYGLKADLEKCLYQLKHLGFINNFILGKKDMASNLIIPKKFYAKKFLKEKIGDFYKHTAGEENYVLIIKGEQGSGKTSIIKELKKILNLNNDYYMSLSIQRSHNGLPYFFMMNEFRNIIKRILMESEDNISAWRYRFINALGANVNIISDYIPEFNLVLGRDYDVENINNAYLFNNFGEICEKIIEIFTENNHVFMITIDDVQWIDEESLRFITRLLEGKIKNFILVCNWTEHEENSESFTRFLNSFKVANVRIETIELEPLSAADIKGLLLDSYSDSINRCEELSNIIEIKTNGNLYFINKFIKEINEHCLIEYNYEKGYWEWNIEQVSILSGKDKLLDSIKGVIDKLPENAKSFLKTVSCFREKFSVYSMAKIFDGTTCEIMKIISICIDKDIIIELEPGEYVFSSRKTAEMVNEMFSFEEKKDITLKIARSLTEEYANYDSKINMFDVLYYYNLVRERIKSEEEVLYLVKLNNEGGLSANNSFAYNEASKFFDIAMGFIDSKFWDKHYELAFDVYVHSIDCFYSSANFTKGDYYSEVLLGKSRSRMDKCRLYNVMIKQYTRWNRIEPAISMAYRAINLMESSSMASSYLNKKSSKAEFNKLIHGLKQKDILKLFDLKENKNIEKRILMDIYSSLWVLGYISGREQICFAAALRMFEISVCYGNMSGSAFGYVCFGAALMDEGEYVLGKDFGILALKLNERYNKAEINYRVKFVYGAKLSFYTEKLKVRAGYIKEAYKAAVKCGDLIYASNCTVLMIYKKLVSGERLPKLQSLLEEALQNMEQGSQAAINLSILNQDLLKLMDKAPECKELHIDNSDKRSRLRFYYFVSKSIQCYLMGEYEAALNYVEKNKAYMKLKDTTTVKVAGCHMYLLILAGLYDKVSKGDKIKCKNKINQLNKKIKKYNCISVKSALFILVEAEAARINDDDMMAMSLYETAIRQAEIDEDNHLCAICNERAFNYYMSRNINKAARMHLRECLRCYEYWGIKTKVDKLKMDYGDMFSLNKPPALDINLNALFKSAQVLSNEMDYGILLKKMISITMKRAGAGRCCLVVEKNNRLYIAADTNSEESDIEIYIKEIPLENYIPILKTVVYYVSRRKETIVIEDAKKSEFYYGEKYINENNVKSVLCIPICYNNKIKTILYFENNLITGVFNKDDIEFLKLLTSQIAASMENAVMYNSTKEINEKLESIVEKRTSELEVTVKMLKEEAAERRAVEEALLESESRLRTLINNTSDCITFKDSKGRYVEINAATVKLLGLEGIDYRNRTTLELCDMVGKEKDTFYKINEMDKIVMQQKVEMRFSEKLLNDKGEEIYFDIVETPVWSKDSEDGALVVIARNITEREKAQELRLKYKENTRKLEEVMEYDKMRNEFIANISHELRTPLNVILSSNQMCNLILKSQKCSELNGKIHKYMGMTKQNCYRLLRLINNLIDITKIDSGYLNPEFVMGDIVNFVEGITTSVVTFAESKGINIIFDTQVEEKYISFDKDKIERIMLNLLSNAIKFTPADGYIYVNICDFFDKISISVKDTGIGIPEEKKTEIFNRFVQLDKSFSRENEGSGIGLALVKSLVDMHKGEIKVISEFGKGAEFIVTIPALLNENVNIKEERNLRDSYEEKIERVRIEFSDIYL